MAEICWRDLREDPWLLCQRVHGTPQQHWWEDKVHHRTGNGRQAAVPGLMYHPQWWCLFGSHSIPKTHTYRPVLNFDSNHHLQHKRSDVRTLISRGNWMVTKQEQKDAEVRHAKSALKANGYKEWAFKIPSPKNKSDTSPNTTGGRARTVWAYYISEVHPKKMARIKKKKHGVGAYHKPLNSLRSILVHPKDKTPVHKTCWVVYEIQCPECPAQYVGETAHTLETRMKYHLKQKSPRTAVGDHEHPIKMDDVKVKSREDNMWRSKIRESIEIRTRHPAINRDQGYEPPPPPPPPPLSVTNCCHVTAVPVVSWPQRVSLIRLMKWAWWSRKLATLQHIWLW